MAAIVTTGTGSSAKKKLFQDGEKGGLSALVITATRKEDAGDTATSLTGQLGRTLKISHTALSSKPRTSPIKLGKRASFAGSDTLVEGEANSSPKRHKPPSPTSSKTSDGKMERDEVIPEKFSWPQSDSELISAAAIPEISNRLKQALQDPPRELDPTPEDLYHWSLEACGGAFADAWLNLPANTTIQLYLPNVPENDIPEVLKVAGIIAEVVPHTNNKGENTGLYTLLVRGYEEAVAAIAALREHGFEEIYPRQSNSNEYPYLVNYHINGITAELCEAFTKQLQEFDEGASLKLVTRKGRKDQVQLTVGKLTTFYEICNRDIRAGNIRLFSPRSAYGPPHSDPAELLVTSALAGTTPIGHFHRAMIAAGADPDKLAVSRQRTTNFVSISVGDPALAVRLACAGAMLDAHRRMPLTLSHFAKSNIAGAKSGDNLLKAFPFLATQFE